MTIGNILISLAIGLGALLLFLVGFVILKTILFSPRQSKGKPRDLASVDGQSVAERLGLAVRIPTLSYLEPEKFDRDAFLELHRLLKTLYSQVHAQLKVETVNDLSLLYTWEGRNPELKPIMLISHMDVVPADEEGWTYPPFSGEIAEGFVWGRGTLDVKDGVIGILEAVDNLLKEGFQPERTVYLGFGHDEEVSGRHGAVAICDLLKSRGVELGSLLDEGGSVIEGFLPGVETPVAVIGISEKGYLSLRLTVSVEGGHSSMPPQETAIGILSKAIVNLEARPMPPHLEVVEFLMGYLGSALPFFQRMLFANTWLFGGILKKQLSKSHLLNAAIRTTIAPTIINAGVKDNVLPGKAEAVVNFRLLPGDDLRTVYEMVLERIHDERVVVTPYEGETLTGGAGWDPSPVADSESPYFMALSNLIKAAFPGTLVSPYLVMGGTDARHYAPVTDCALRFSPIHMTLEDLQRVHGVNERLSFENCARMVAFYIAYIRDLSSLDGELDAFSETAVEEEYTVVTEVFPDEAEEALLTPDSVEDEEGEEE
ncbi:MAG: M20 family peptidase [Chloroflexota bacterium]|nr:M20 family peptidase [Chloroflexota bacterium]